MLYLSELFYAADENERKKYAAQVLNNFKKRITGTVRKYNKDCTIFYNSGHVGPDICQSLDHCNLERNPRHRTFLTM